MGITQWVVDNKQWLFSGVGVAFLVWALPKLKAVLAKQSAKASPRTNEDLQVIITASVQPLELKSTWDVQPTAEQVLDSIRNAPVLQQPDFAHHYRGVAVSWEGILIGARKLAEDHVRLQLNCSEASLTFTTVFVDVNPTRYPGIGLLKNGARIHVDGVIDEVTDLWIIVGSANLRYGVA